MTDIHERRMNVLHRVETGELNLEDANRLLTELEERASDGSEIALSAQPEQAPQAVGLVAYLVEQQPTVLAGLPQGVPADSGNPAANRLDPEVSVAQSGQVIADEKRQSPDGWRSLWLLPFLLGLLLTMVSINWMYLGWVAAGLGWGFWLSFFPLALGIGLMWFGWELRIARWLHVRIRQMPGAHPRQIAFSLPLPIGLTRWAVQRFSKYSPQVNGRDIADFLDEFDQEIATDGPMHVFVDDEDGEKVEIWVDGPKK
jgi:hypothetical protein